MDSSRPTLIELVGASKRVAQRTLDLSSNRVELLITELHEERDRIFSMFLLALGAAALALLAGFALTLGIMVLLWNNSPAIALAVLTVLYAAGAVLLYSKVLRLQRTFEMFASTLDQFRKDRQWLGQHLH